MSPLAVVLATFVATGSVAYTTRTVPTYGAQAEGDPVLLSNADGENAYTGVVRYQGRATCTGVFLDTIPDGEDPGNAPAYVATNGHCPDFPGPNEVLLDRPAPRWTDAWPSIRFPTVVRVRIDTVPPRIAAPLSIREDASGWFIQFLTQEPEVGGYLVKYGRPGQTRCSDPADYRPSLIPFITLPRRDAPYTFCAIPYDSALNQGAVIDRLLL